MVSVQRRIDKALKEVEEIHSLLHPMSDSDPKLNLYQARSRREDAVRATVIQMSLSIEDLLDALFSRAFVGHDPNSKKRGSWKHGPARELHDLLQGGRLGFEPKLKLARVMRIVTKGQLSRLDKLRALRNKCAHSWLLDKVHKRGRRPRPSKRLLEYEGRNLFELSVIKDFVGEYSRIYLRLYVKYLS
jgi:hypothetical protein